MKRFIVLILFLILYNSYSQNNLINEKPPLFPNCETVSINDQKDCFNNNVYQFIYDNFEVPQKVLNENYIGAVSVIFEVDATGQFKVVYTDAIYDELKEETKRIFGLFPIIKPS